VHPALGGIYGQRIFRVHTNRASKTCIELDVRGTQGEHKAVVFAVVPVFVAAENRVAVHARGLHPHKNGEVLRLNLQLLQGDIAIIKGSSLAVVAVRIVKLAVCLGGVMSCHILGVVVKGQRRQPLF